jgi:uncharacterized membrane protein
MLEFLLFIVAAVAFRFAMTARSEARRARADTERLERDLKLLRTDLDVLNARTWGVAEIRARMPAGEPAARTAAAMPEPMPEPMPAPGAGVAQAPVPEAVNAPQATPAQAPAPRPELSTEAPAAMPTAMPADLAPASGARRPPRPPPQWLTAVKGWLFGGNLVAKLGLLILFIGISFLLKYTAARVTLPIEFRLAGIVLADIALLAWGWRIRITRPGISLPIQGTALAVLMLVTFGAFRLYHLIPGGLAFALLFVLTVFTCVLAVLQDSMWLAIFGIVGGFAAPIMASTGGGSHVGLFSYYALLNGGVFALSVLRSWRPLNLLGFAFTFAIGTAWGVLRYQPENYLSVQLFLLLFFLFYVSIALAYARQQAVRLKNYVDGTLIFGTPMLAFGLQFSIVRGFEFGVAFSALALGLFYLLLATLLSRRRDRYGLLADTFLALGVVFGTLAIPFALDGRWTSAAWALEGAGIVWVGLRQKQRLAWMFGLLVQAGAWISFTGTVTGLSSASALDSNLWLGFLLLAITAFLMATRFRAQPMENERGVFMLLASVFLTFAAVWLVAGAWTEILLRTNHVLQANLLVASALLAAIVLGLIAKRMAWKLATRLALAVQALAGCTLLLLTIFDSPWTEPTLKLFDTPVLGALMIWAGAMFSSWALMRQQQGVTSRVSGILLLWSGVWWYMMIVPVLSGWLAAHYMVFRHGTGEVGQGLWWSVYGLLVAACTAPLLRMAQRLQWRALRWQSAAAWIAMGGATLGMLSELYAQNQLPGGEAWLAYAALWAAAEWLLHVWPRNGWRIAGPALRLLHTLRTVGPWMMIWPTAAVWIARWLSGAAGGDAGSSAASAEAQLLADAGWHASASWARFIPAWLMMAALAWLMRRVQADTWPVRPIAAWYRRYLLPLACGWSLLLVAAWNLTQDGAMAPLPYVPLVNPLDLTSCFALLLAIACYRTLARGEGHHGSTSGSSSMSGSAGTSGIASLLAASRTRLAIAAALLAYTWFNLALLRTVAHYGNVPYQFDDLFASQFVQAMLSLVWSVSALLLMRYSARRAIRTGWIGGAVLLGVVVAKLFLVDLSNVGGVERIISFLGVGALMVGIGYLAPYPSSPDGKAAAEAT